MTSPSKPDQPTRATLGAILALMLVLHLGRTVFYLAPDLGFVVDAAPVGNVDHPFHAYHMDLGERFWRQAGTTWGYDPSFFAGYVKCPVWDGSVKLLEAVYIPAAAVGRGLFGAAASAEAVEKWCVLALPLAAFLLLWLAWGNLGLAPAEALLAQSLGLLNFWFQKPAHLLRYGMVGHLAATYLGFWLLSLVFRGLRRQDRSTAVLLFVAGPLTLLAHVGGPIPLLLPLVLLYALHARELRARWHAVLVGAAAMSLLLNLWWLANLYRFLGVGTDTGHILASEDFLGVWANRVQAFGLVGGTARAAVRLAALPLAGAGLWLWARRDGWRLPAALGLGAVFLHLTVYYGSAIPVLKQTQPSRFLPAAVVFLLPGCAVLAVTLASRATRWLPAKAASALPWLLPAAAALPLALPIGPHGLARTPADAARIAADIRAFAGPQTGPGRILMESGPVAPIHVGHVANWFPRDTGREFVTAQVPTPFVIQKTARYELELPFGIAVQEAAGDPALAARVRELTTAYGCAWVMVCTPASIAFWDAQSDFVERTGETAPFVVYRVRSGASLFARGTGRVEARLNEILLTDLVPDGGEVVLRYHWFPSLATDPPCRLEEGPAAPGDPVGFLRLVDPPPSVRVYNGYRLEGPLFPGRSAPR